MTVRAIPRKARVVRSVERILLITGVILLTAFVGVRLYGVIVSRYALETFQQKVAAGVLSSHADSGTMTRPAGVDTSLWSDKRIRAYNDSLKHVFGAPLAVLSIPKIHLEVPVFEGTDEVTLDRGAGRIAGTAHPGQAGNLGIAGHRDGFFRGLKNMTQGDEITLALPKGEATYVVDQITVVTPQDVSVLQPRPISSITLVTCFPFYFVGSAPERYIVSASLRADAPPAVSRNARLNP
jgi:sortase A